MEPETHLVHGPAHREIGCAVGRIVGLHKPARGHDLPSGLVESVFGQLQIAEDSRIAYAALRKTRRHGAGQDAQALGITLDAGTRIGVTDHTRHQVRFDALDERRRGELLGAVPKGSIP